jgi:hypothetical protein
MHNLVKSVLKLGICSLAVIGTLTWTGSESTPMTGTTAFAAGLAVSPSAKMAIATSIKAAINGVSPSLTGEARTAAVKNALARATQSAVEAYGTDAVSIVLDSARADGVPLGIAVSGVLAGARSAGMTGAAAVTKVTLAMANCSQTVGKMSCGDATMAAGTVIAVATLPDSGVSTADLGAGLGVAAAEMWLGGNTSAANTVAVAVASEAPLGAVQPFTEAILANGGPLELAQRAKRRPDAVGEINGGGGTLNDNSGNGDNGNNNTCPTNNPSCNS